MEMMIYPIAFFSFSLLSGNEMTPYLIHAEFKVRCSQIRGLINADERLVKLTTYV